MGGYAGTEKTETLEIGDAKWKIHEDVGISSFLRPAAVTLNNKIYVIGTYAYAWAYTRHFFTRAEAFKS